MPEERIVIGFARDDFVVAPSGHITASLCPQLKEKATAALRFGVDGAGFGAARDQRDVRAGLLRFDFSSCEYMDSTFLGLLVFLAKGAKKSGLGAPVIHRANEECASLLRTMGMTAMFVFSEAECPKPARAEVIGAEADLTAKFLLDAHADLSGLNAENSKRFEKLIEALEKETDV
jgi:hypothetical protein